MNVSPSSVCHQCKKRKKKCDKQLPNCGRCARLRINCVYTPDLNDFENPFTGCNGGAIDVLSLAKRKPNSTIATQWTVPLPEMVSPFAFITSLPGFYGRRSLSRGDLGLLDFDDQLTLQAFDIMTRNGDSITALCERYFALTEKWLPIIDTEEFFARLPCFQTTPSASFSTLVLCMCLYTQSLSDALGRSRQVESLYYTAKCFHSVLQSTGRISVEVIQAGLLIAMYEHYQALHQASLLSVGTCARMGYALGLHKTLRQEFALDSLSKKEVEEARRTWWAIFIVERTMAIQDVQSRLPFACQTPTLDDLLPLDTKRKGKGGNDLGSNEGYYSVSYHLDSGVSTQLGPFPRSAQSAYLLHQVLEYVAKPLVVPKAEELQVAHLDKSLQSIILAMLEPVWGWGQGDYCGAYSGCISALLCLHLHQISIEPSKTESADGPSRSLLAVDAASRMVIQASEMSVGDPKLDWDLMPFWGLTVLYLAAMSRVNHFQSTKEWMERIAPAVAYLRHFEPKWKLAGDYLAAVENAASIKTAP